MIVLGVDPGIHGAMAWYDTEDRYLFLADIPTVSAKRGKTAKDVDGTELANLLVTKFVNSQEVHTAFVEQVSSRPRQGGQFSFGVNYGRVLGVLEATGIPVVNASPQKWKQAMGLRTQDKGMSVRLAAELFPDYAHNFYGPRGAGLDGRAEAALIAYWGSKQKEI
jgi:crossover junction endodeoxyribonuclease RuvC